MVEVDIGLIISFLPPIIQVKLVDRCLFIVMVMIEVDIGLISVIFLHITMTDYTLPTQCFLKNIFQEVWKEKINTKIILINIIIICAFHHTLIQVFHNILITTFHLILIQACHHTQFVCVHIVLLLLCMNLRMKFCSLLSCDLSVTCYFIH